MPRRRDTTKTDADTVLKPQTRGRRPKSTQPVIPTVVVDIPDLAPAPSEASPGSPAGTIGFVSPNDAYFFTPKSSPVRPKRVDKAPDNGAYFFTPPSSPIRAVLATA